MIAKVLRWPWGRTICVLGAALAFAGYSSDPSGSAPMLATFVFAGVALHAIATWRDKS